MTSTSTLERVADTLTTEGYRLIEPPLKISDVEFNVAGAFVAGGPASDLVVVGDTDTEGELQVLRQVKGIARALDAVRSTRPLTTVILGPRPTGKIFEALSQFGRVLSVGKANDPKELRTQLAILLPLKLPDTTIDNRNLEAGDALPIPDNPLSQALISASDRGEEAVRFCFHETLKEILSPDIAAYGDSSSESP